jgi:ParB family chromosome partitioning protein
VALAQDVVARDLNVRETERLVQSGKPPKPGKGRGGRTAAGPAAPAKDADTRALERDLSLLLGLKVAIDLKGESGDISIHFETLEQLDDVLHRLKRDPQARNGTGGGA